MTVWLIRINDATTTGVPSAFVLGCASHAVSADFRGKIDLNYGDCDSVDDNA